MDSIEKLTEAHAKLQALRPLKPELLEELRHLFDVRLTHHSTAIEGNTLTQSETQIVIEKGITIAGKTVEEHLEVIGHKEALDFVIRLADSEEPLRQRQIKEIHSLVMKGQTGTDHGAYRTINVLAAGTEYNYPNHLKVQELMDEFEEWLGSEPALHPVHFASEAHLRFVTIHPFRDGNGRVGRLLLNLLLIRAGYPIAVIPVSKRAEYIEALVAAQSGKGRRLLDGLVQEAVGQSFETIFSMI